MTLGDRLINEKTRVGITLANFLILIIFVVTSVAAASSWKTSIENTLEHNQESIYENECAIEEATAVQIKNQTALVRIETDIQWIRAALEKDN